MKITKLDKKGASLKGIVVTLILMSMMMVGYNFILADVHETYSPNASEDLNETMGEFDQQFNKLNNEVTEARNQSFSTKADQTTDVGLGLGSGLITAKNAITQSFSTATHLLGSVERYLGIPSFWRQGAIGITVFIMIIVFLGVIFRKRLNTS